MSLEKLSNHILSVVNKNGGTITNLELQKVLFFTVGMSLRNNPSEIDFFNEVYNDDFEKWRYGPVIPNLYFKYNIHGAMPIKDKGVYFNEYKRFDNLILKLSQINVYRLVALSHDMKAWAENESKILEGSYVRPYTLEEIVRDFENDK